MLATKTAVATHQDRYLRPVLAELGDDARQVFEGTGRGVEVRRSQQRQQGMVATKYVQWQITIAVVIAMEKAAELMAVQGSVRGVEVQDDALGRRGLLLQEGIDQEALHGVEAGHDLLVATARVGPHGGKFETVERALAGERLAAVFGTEPVPAFGIAFADENGQQGIVAQAVMVVEIFVAQAQSEEPLLEQLGKGVLDQVGIAVIGEAAGKLLDEVELGFDLTEHQATGVGGNLATVETGDDFAGSEVLEKHLGWVTLCHSELASWVGMKVFGTTLFMPTQGPSRQWDGEKFGLDRLPSHRDQQP